MDYKGLTIQFDGDASKLLSVLRQIDREASATQTSLGRISAALKLDPTNQTLYQAQTRLLNRSLKDEEASLASLRREYERYKKEEPEKQARALSDAEKKAAQAIQERQRVLESEYGRSAKYMTEYQQNAQALKLIGEHADTSSTRVSWLKKETDRYTERLDALRTQYEETAAGGGKYGEHLTELQEEIAITEAKVKGYKEELEATSRLSFFNTNPFGQWIRSTEQFGQSLYRVGSYLSNVIGLRLTMIEGAAAIGFGRSVLAEVEDYTNAISRVGGYLDITGAKLEQMSGLALYWGKETQFSATEAADAMSELAKGGMTDAQIKAGALEATMQLAAAGGIDMATAAGVAVNAIKVFGLNAEDATDVADALAGAANKSTAEISDLSSAFRYVSGWAGLADYSINDVSGALGLLADYGLTGQMAGTGLRNVIQRLAAPTGKAKELLEQYGVEVYDSSGKVKDLSSLVGELSDAFSSLDEETRNNVLNTIFGARGLPAAVALMEAGQGTLSKYVDATKREGYALEMMQARMGDIGWALEYLRGEFETFKVSIGKAMEPYIIEVANALEDMLETFNSWPVEKQRGFVMNLIKAAAVAPGILALGTALKVVGGTAMTISRISAAVAEFLPALAKGRSTFESASAAVSALTGGMMDSAAAASLLKTSFGMLGVAVAAYVGYKLWSLFEKDRKRAESLNTVIERTGKLLGNAGPNANKMATSLYDVGDAAKGTARDLDDLLTSLSDFYDKVDETLGDVEIDDSRLNRAWQIISELGGRGDLDETQLSQLAGALAYINETLGTNYALHSDTSGIIYDENDNVVNLTASIWRLIEAQKAQIRADAYGSLLEDAYKNQADALATLAEKRERYNEILEGRAAGKTGFEYSDYALQQATDDYAEAAQAAEAAGAAVEKLEADYDQAALDAQKAAEATQNALADTVDTIEGLSEKLDEQGISVFDFVGLTNDEFQKMLEESGGDLDILIQKLQEWRDNQPTDVDVEFETNADEAEQDIQRVFDSALNAADNNGDGWTIEFTPSLEDGAIAGILGELESIQLGDWTIDFVPTIEDGAIYQFITWLSDNMPKDTEVDLDVEADAGSSVLTWFLQQLGLIPEEKTVSVEADGNIPDGSANEQIDTYNHSRLSKKTGTATLSGSFFTFMEKLFPEWKRTPNLGNKSGTANVYGNLSQATNDLKEWNRLGMESKWGRATIALAISSKGVKAAGLANGGMLYRHADGYITNHSLYSGNHVIGEAGIEAVLPLNNRAATQPLVDAIADGVSSRIGGGNQYNLYINDARVNDDPAIRSAFIDLMGAVNRKGMQTNAAR